MKNPTYSIVTSFNKRIYNNESQQIVSDMETNHPEIDFYVYHENSFERANHGQEIDFSNKIRDKLHLYDLFEVTDWLTDFLKTSPFKNCDKISFRGSTPQDPGHWNRNAIYWFRKVVALKHCIDTVDTDYLIWLDADTVFRTDKGHEYGFDQTFFDFVKNYDCSVIRRDKLGLAIETGIIVFNLNRAGKQVIYDWLEYFLSLKAFKEPRWDDGYILTVLLNNQTKYTVGSLRYGWPGNNVYRYVKHFRGPLLYIRDQEKGV